MVSIHVLLILLTNRNLTLIYSVIKKQKIVHRQRTSNINYRVPLLLPLMFTACHNQFSLLTVFKATKEPLEASTYDEVIFHHLASGVTFDFTVGLWLTKRTVKRVNTVNYWGKLITIDYNSPSWGCTGDRVEMIVEVHCGTVLNMAANSSQKRGPQCTLTTISTPFLAQP